MIKKLLRLTLLVFLCLTFASKMALADVCDDSNEQTTISLNCDDDASCPDCHCSHGHFDFAFFSDSFDVNFVKIENNIADLTRLLPYQISSQKRPPKSIS